MEKLTLKYNSAIAIKRKSKDIVKLMMSNYKVNKLKDEQDEFIVIFDGPQGSFYENGQ